MSLDIEIFGDRELSREFELYADEKQQRKIFNRSTKKAIQEELLPDVLAKAPFRTGLLRSNITIGSAQRRGEVGQAIFTKDVPYAMPLETGHKTRGGKTQVAGADFLRQAVDEKKDSMLDKTEQGIQEGLDELSKQAGTL